MGTFNIDIADSGFNIPVNSVYGPLVVNRNDAGQPQFIRQQGEFDFELQQHLCNIAKHVAKRRGGKGSFLDVGANLGVFSLWFAQNIPQVTVHAFEMQRLMFYCLTANVALGSHQNIYPHHCAVGHCSKTIKVPTLDYQKQALFGSLSLLPKTNQDTRQTVNYEDLSESVPMVCLDDHDYGRIDMIKIDIEGMELMALQGAEKCINQHRPVLFLEWSKSNVAELFKWLEDHGYKVYKVNVDLLCLHTADPVQEKISIFGPELLTYESALEMNKIFFE